MLCRVYRSGTQTYTYLYLAEGKELEDLPEFLMEKFGPAELCLELDLSERSQLAQANIDTVRASLLQQGYYLQLPPERSIEELLDRQFNR